MFYFVNCMMLTFGPPITIYRSTQLALENSSKSCMWAGIGYALTQALKIFVMATFLPTDDTNDNNLNDDGIPFNLQHAVMESAVNVIEFLGVQLTLEYTRKLSHIGPQLRILAVGLGWTFAESCFYLVPLWLGARGMEFSWEYIGMGVQANIDMLLHMGFITAVWLRTRIDLEQKPLLVSYIIIVIHVILPSTKKYMDKELGQNDWQIKAFLLVIGLCSGIVSRYLLRRYQTQKYAAPQKSSKTQTAQ